MIRPAHPRDEAELGGLEVELFGTGAWRPADLLGADGADRWVRVTMDAQGRVAGYVVTTTAGEVVDLLRIGVRPDHQGNGLGGLLLTAALDAARQDEPSPERMMLEVSDANAAARALYAGHGFAVVDRRRHYYPDGSDALVMSLDLGSAL
ncbi:MAG: GNAT family N-acetyltransferase [Nocardioidaceae bacterium]